MGTLIRSSEIKENAVILALLRMPYCVWQYVLLETPYLEEYLYAKLGTPIQGREFRVGNAFVRAFGVGHTAMQCYPK